jgi:thioredoxin reductase (NADPH)
MPDHPEAFPELGAAELSAIEALATRRQVSEGEYLYREGDAAYDFYVVLSGAVEILARSDGEDRVVARHGAGRFLGELNLLTGLRVFVSARVVESGEVLVVSRESFRQIIASNPRLSDTILPAFLARRAVLVDGASGSLRIIGSRFSPETRRVREYLARSRIPHEWLDPERDVAVEEILREFGVGRGDLPAVIASGAVLRRATPGSVAEYLGLTLSSMPERCFDLVVVGGGPAGLASAVYGASEGLSTLGVEMIAAGGQAGTTSRIENYLGFPTGISGVDLTQRAVAQAEKFGARLTSPCTATSLREKAGHLVVHLSDGTDVAGRAVIAATGARYRRLDADGLDDFEDNGVYYAATEMEARLCAPSPVVVVGGGNSAGQAALYLADSGSPVTVVIRGPDLSRSMSRYLVDRIEADPRIAVRTNTTVAALAGERTLSSVRLRGESGPVEVPCVALFSFIGAEPGSGWLSGCAAVDPHGFILSDRALDDGDLDERWAAIGRGPLPFETSHPGLFAVGDVRSGSTKRVAAAVGEGSAAVRSVHEYLAFDH